MKSLTPHSASNEVALPSPLIKNGFQGSSVVGHLDLDICKNTVIRVVIINITASRRLTDCLLQTLSMKSALAQKSKQLLLDKFNILHLFYLSFKQLRTQD